jgi:HK97 family phage portal protein
MRIFGKEIALWRKQIPQQLSPASSSASGWWSSLFPFLVHEANTGDWQRNIVLAVDCLLAHPIVFACITLIAGDIGKLRPQLRRYDDAKEIYIEVDSPAYSPVLNTPNSYQNRIEFFTQWLISLLAFGNTYVLKVRDNRNVVQQMYILDPRRVVPLVATGGEVFYQLMQDNLADIEAQVTVPATEIIHDKINCIFHPLVGMSPLFGGGLAATQALEIQRNSTRFFRKGATPAGILTIPGSVDADKARKIKETWGSGFTGENAGAVAVLADGAQFKQMTMSSVDSELVKQLNLTSEQICSCFHVPGYMVGVGSAPTYNNIEALSQQYYNQCLQVLIEKIELCLTQGLGMDTAKPTPFSVNFDIKQLLRMDTAARYKANSDAINGGWLAPNEARRDENLPPVKGGDSPFLQEQNFSLEALAKRDAQANPWAPATPPPATPSEPTPAPAEEDASAKAQELTDTFLLEVLNHCREYEAKRHDGI